MFRKPNLDNTLLKDIYVFGKKIDEIRAKKKKIHFPYSSLKQCFPTVMCTQILEGSCGLCLVWPGLKESAFLTSCLVLVILLVPKLYFVGGPRRHLHFLSFTPFNLLFFLKQIRNPIIFSSHQWLRRARDFLVRSLRV